MLLQEFLERSAERYPDKVALVCRSRRLNYREIDMAANSFANALIGAGFRKQDRAVIFLENSVESVVSLFGVLKAGGVFVIIDPKVRDRKLKAVLDNCEASLIVTSESLYAQVSNAISTSLSLRFIVFVDEEAAGKMERAGKKVLSYGSFLKKSSTVRPVPACIDIDLASLIYTSGSSGSPKGVMLTHLNMVSAANSITRYLENTGDDVIINTLPLAFDYGLYQVIMAFKCGATLILEKAFVFPQQIINIIVREKVTGWPIVPTIAAILLRLKDLDKHDFSSLRYITSTGQAMPPRHLELLQAAFPGVKIFSMYGLTECKRVSYLPPEELNRRPGSVGKAMPNTEVYLVDEKNEKIEKPWQSGELVVRGANVMKGYWNLPEETARYLRPGPYPGENVLYTGDLFKIDEEGYLYFLSRKDDIIKTAGHMVSPKEVESVLCEHGDVVEAVVMGVEDEILGKAVTAFVHLAENSFATEKEIIQFCAERLEEYAVPRNIVLLNSLPKTNNGKISRKELKSSGR